MARFDLFSNPSAKSKAKSPYLLDIQSNHLGDLSSRVVVPLTRVLGSYTPTTIARDLSPVCGKALTDMDSAASCLIGAQTK
jgi:toxin CcdB